MADDVKTRITGDDREQAKTPDHEEVEWHRIGYSFAQGFMMAVADAIIAIHENADGRREDMADNVKIKIRAIGVDEAQAKVDALNEKLAEARALIADLASALDELGFHFDRE
ncbi:MAG: hypothetical protein IJJ45_00090 [Clostridia bacterium]|nr:hypothetical protein [Clostridia bacterium]